MKGQEASSWLKMVTRKMKLVTEVLSDTVHNVSPPQARKNRFIWMGHLYGALSPGTTCWPGGGLKCSPGVGGSKMASRGEEWLLTPPTPTYDSSGFHQVWFPLMTSFFQPTRAASSYPKRYHHILMGGN